MASRTSVSRPYAKYQLAIPERQKQRGYVLDYPVWAQACTSEGSRWDYRVVITRTLPDSAYDERTIATDSYRRHGR
jgi:hypothetical protein